MQRINLLGVVFCLLAGLTSNAQTSNNTITPVSSYHLTIGYNKTSNIIFPFSIKSVDIGNGNVLAQKAKGVDNILQLKADKQGFAQTNVTVVTSDRQFYSFLLDYASNPSTLNFSVGKDTTIASLSDNPVDEAAYQKNAQAIKGYKRFIHQRTKEQRIILSLESIYLSPSIMWFGVRITNRSLIDYKPDYFRFFIADKKRTKRTAAQQKEIRPYYGNGSTIIGGGNSEFFVFAFEPFTLPKTQELVIQVGEHNGGRNLTKKVRYKTVLKTRILPD